MKNPNWLREELILALDLYFKLSFGQMDGRNPLVKSLSEELKALGLHQYIPDTVSFRSPNSVSLKLANFKSFDPGRSGTGMEGSGLLDRQVWNEFHTDRARLAVEAGRIRANKTRLPVERDVSSDGSATEPTDEYAAVDIDDETDPHEHSYPDPDAVLQSLRAFGYSLDTAVADLIDNSITAEATEIRITFGLDGVDSFLRIEDNGQGMSLAELRTAMRIGSISPLTTRSSSDLGRFGLGLKTASFSQCRRLTVKTRQESAVFTRVWDLDNVKDWVLGTYPVNSSSETNLGNVMSASGTIVLWEDLDRLIEIGDTTRDKENFYRKLEALKIHLGLIFHRYIEEGSLTIYVGTNPVAPFNPFDISDNFPSKELSASVYSLGTSRVEIQPYILPHESRLAQHEIKKLDIIRGWNEHQGIFLYRNRRLILDGTWLDLPFRKKENQRLVRIQVDIPNTADKEWHIDVKKAHAKVPDALRKQFMQICVDAIEEGKRVYSHRGSYVRRRDEDDQTFVWKARQQHGRRAYVINDKHPVYEAICQLLGSEARLFRDYIRIIAETLPVGMLINDFTDSKTVVETDVNGDKTILNDMYENTLHALTKAGMSREQALQELNRMEIFHTLNR
ncbi:histidine kinase/DNA gyrase B/HSP90-like ATPase [Spirosoma oryzae]|uniref:Histidine kinase/DNA gyrase B/HSP90-like ATPase n=1 Tax=Spirosoma oryzae TaxID=1469603 RepID=A0A2T0RNK9_9BACT|nr:ATP-binding protein [Spirosoma oryzae]PRY22731.1 histidine kinase/DNA gyrase B/HSP90-like ATPase [Spirosoma oryzae]